MDWAILVVAVATFIAAALPVSFYIREKRRHAAFKVTTSVVESGGLEIVRGPTSQADYVVMIGIKNTGTKAAEDVLLNLVVCPATSAGFGEGRRAPS